MGKMRSYQSKTALNAQDFFENRIMKWLKLLFKGF